MSRPAPVAGQPTKGPDLLDIRDEIGEIWARFDMIGSALLSTKDDGWADETIAEFGLLIKETARRLGAIDEALGVLRGGGAL
jgi:hypothetical protein